MSNRALIITDIAFVLVLTLIYQTNGLRDYPVILSPLIVLAFAACVIRHINYYRLTKKIY
jgi:Kef-type K+ transport system membrane component KefB